MDYESSGAAETFVGCRRTSDAIADDNGDNNSLVATKFYINDDATDHMLVYNAATTVGPLVDCIRNTLTDMTDLHATTTVCVS